MSGSVEMDGTHVCAFRTAMWELMISDVPNDRSPRGDSRKWRLKAGRTPFYAGTAVMAHGRSRGPNER